MNRERQPDVVVEDHGSVVLVQPLTAQARDWIDENVQDDAMWWSGGLVVEPRYVDDLANGMLDAGLEVV